MLKNGSYFISWGKARFGGFSAHERASAMDLVSRKVQIFVWFKCSGSCWKMTPISSRGKKLVLGGFSLHQHAFAMFLVSGGSADF